MMTTQAEIEELSSEEYSLREEKWRIGQAEKAGFEIFRGDPNTLTFDLDGEEALAEFRVRVKILEQKAFQPVVQISRSKSGNYHAVVKIMATRPLEEPVRLAIQACLGSEWKREFLGILRYLNDQKSVSMLFRPQPLEIVE